ncbi:hypothetical protein IE53DRAFT_388488 [Violaceomyces palustris]|uniref:Uncharacterized protein n=1 Tax=Violaceomyces palustris TaxID=1673888 RepID=A0ACD0NU11_9BASI|nr:hypothetical protein IE53DRAFT_388488 [Violaceomyces palustris]
MKGGSQVGRCLLQVVIQAIQTNLAQPQLLTQAPVCSEERKNPRANHLEWIGKETEGKEGKVRTVGAG